MKGVVLEMLILFELEDSVLEQLAFDFPVIGGTEEVNIPQEVHHHISIPLVVAQLNQLVVRNVSHTFFIGVEFCEFFEIVPVDKVCEHVGCVGLLTESLSEDAQCVATHLAEQLMLHAHELNLVLLGHAQEHGLGDLA